MRKTIYLILLLITAVLSQPYMLRAEAKSRYVTLQYDGSSTLLRDFNSELILSRNLRYYLLKKHAATIEDEVLAKLDIIIEKIETVFDIFPANLHITIVLLPTSRDVSAIYRGKYCKKVDFIAYYSLKENTIYLSVDDASLRVIAHEVGHAIINQYFDIRPSYDLHEMMAEFAEEHISD